MQMARDRAEFFRDTGISKIFCSPFLRTLQTANEFARVLGIEQIHIDGELSEVFNLQYMKQPSVEFLSRAEVSEIFPTTTFDWDYFSCSPKPIFGESQQTVYHFCYNYENIVVDSLLKKFSDHFHISDFSTTSLFRRTSDMTELLNESWLNVRTSK